MSELDAYRTIGIHPIGCKCLHCCKRGERPTNDPPCFVCGKPKGQPPDRCPGHYEMPPMPTDRDTAPQPEMLPRETNAIMEALEIRESELLDRIAALEASNGNAFVSGAAWMGGFSADFSAKQAARAEAERRGFVFKASRETFLESKIATLEAQLAEAQKQRDFAQEVMAYASGKREQDWMEGVVGTAENLVGAILYQHRASLEAQLAEAQARLAMAVEALEYVSARVRPCRAAWDNREVVGQGSTAEICVKVCFGDLRKVAEAGGIADNALTATAPAVAEFLAGVERRGAIAVLVSCEQTLRENGMFAAADYLEGYLGAVRRADELEGK